jgi:molecular chaperone DnaJ
MRWADRRQGWKDVLQDLQHKAPHEVLGVTPDAPKNEIRAAYLSLVKRYHPDKSDQFMQTFNGEMLKLINSAYEKMVRSDLANG